MTSLGHEIDRDRTLATESELRCAIANAYRDLGRRNMNHGSSGNISCRHGDTILITPSGIDFDAVIPDSITVMNSCGEVQGPGTPSCEWEMHLEIYRMKPDARSVVHTHSDACVALSSLRRPIPAFHYMVAAFGGNDIPCASYAAFGSRELARSAAAALATRTACLLANHGMVCHGPNLAATLSTAVELEALARQYLMATQAGVPISLTESEVSTVQERLYVYSSAKPKRCYYPACDSHE
jgi:L-fuculose-phosphate aldolase